MFRSLGLFITRTASLNLVSYNIDNSMNNLDAKELQCFADSYVVGKEAAIYTCDQPAKHLVYSICLMKKQPNKKSIELDGVLI
jgi:translation initiation factor RLI1